MDNNQKQPLIQNKKFLCTDVYNNKKKIIKNQKYSSFNNLATINGKVSNENFPQISNTNNIINFIKQKKRFFIENSFDNKGTREFLASKEVAMRVIKLNDEIIEEQKNNHLTNKNLLKLNFINADENENLPNNIKRNKSSKTAGKRNNIPRKSKKTNKKVVSDHQLIKLENKKTKKSKKNKKQKSEKECKQNNNSLIENSNKCSDNIKNIIFDKASNDSQSNIYKLFIDHANEPDENFNKILKKELKKVENLKNNKKTEQKKSESTKNLKLRPKRFNSVAFLKKRENQNIFKFSEINKNLMKNDDIDVSSISGGNNGDSLRKKKIKRTYGSIQINNKQIKENIRKKINKGRINDKYNNNKIEINSDKESIISILSDLM